MFGSKKNIDPVHEDIETVIGQNTVIEGNIEGGSNIRIDGRVNGGVTISGSVVIGEMGSVHGDINAESLLISGSVSGNVKLTGNLSISENGQLVGDVQVASLNIADGGIFRGRSEMQTRNDFTLATEK